MNNEPTSALKPPYLSYTTFKNFLAGLKKGVIPTRIDKTIMPGQSGATQSYLISSLKFFSLIDERGAPKEALHELVEADESHRRAVWLPIFESAYNPIIDGLDLERASVGELQERFQKQNLNGATVKKCHSFFVAAAEAAGVPLATHLKGNARGSSGPRKSRKARIPGNGGGNDYPPAPPPPPPPVSKTMKEMLMEKFPAFDPTWDKAIQTEWFAGFKKLMESAESVA